MTSHDAGDKASKKTIKFHGDVVANVVIALRSQGGAGAAETEKFDAALDPLACETINVQVVADFVTITFYREEQAQSVIKRELIPSHRVEHILIEDEQPTRKML